MNFQGQNNGSESPLSQTSTSQQISTSTETFKTQYNNEDIKERLISAIKDIEEAKKGIEKNETTMFFVVIILLVMVATIVMSFLLFFLSEYADYHAEFLKMEFKK